LRLGPAHKSRDFRFLRFLRPRQCLQVSHRSLRCCEQKNCSLLRSPELSEKRDILTTAGGRIICPQCQARARSTGAQCRKPAITGKRVCRTHGGSSTGPRTEEGRRRCAEARTVHGEETRAKRAERSEVTHRLALLEALAYALGMMSGPRTRGRKPREIQPDQVRSAT